MPAASSTTFAIHTYSYHCDGWWFSGYHSYLSGTVHSAQARYLGFNSLITSKSLYSSMRPDKLIIREAITGAHPSQIFLVIIHECANYYRKSTCHIATKSYWTVGNFWGRKHSWISHFCGCFLHKMLDGGVLWHGMNVQSAKNFPLKVSRYTVRDTHNEILIL